MTIQNLTTKIQRESQLSQLLKTRGQQIAWAQKGSLLKGTVLNAGNNKMLIDLGPTGIGVIMGPELKECLSILGKLKRGDEVSAKVLIPENEEGYVELSVKEAMFEETWKELENKFSSGKNVEATVIEANKGGLLMKFKGATGFLPVSQLSHGHYPKVEGGDKGKIVQELKKLITSTLNVKIIDLDPKEKRIIFSEKAASNKIEQEEIQDYQKGDVIEGVVTGILHFGAFVQIQGTIEGLVHISELAWRLIEKPEDIVKIGDKVKAKIIDTSNGKISLSMKALQEDPWISIAEKYKKGDIINGTVTKLNPFGAFIALDQNIHGLCHISEFGTQEKMESELKISEKKKFEILSIDSGSHRMALRITTSKKSKKDDKEQDLPIDKTEKIVVEKEKKMENEEKKDKK